MMWEPPQNCVLVGAGRAGAHAVGSPPSSLSLAAWSPPRASASRETSPLPSASSSGGRLAHSAVPMHDLLGLLTVQ
jgi:hypothetical protein